MTREFDIVIYGATGFSGKLIAAYLHTNYGSEISIALAGRSASKLNALREELGVKASVLIGNSDELEAMRSIASRTRLVVSCTGPFLLYGSNMVQACAELGTDYVDVTGEVYWSSKMIAAHEAAAKTSGARIISFCGFDSVPSDLGVYLLQKRAVETRGAPFKRIKMRVNGLRGCGLGGSKATMEALMAAVPTEPEIIPFMQNAFGLSPEFKGVAQPSGHQPVFDEDLNSWAAPFLMSDINTKIVHRTNWQRGFPYGQDFVYDEMSATGPGEAGKTNSEHSIKTLGGFDWNGDSLKNLKPGDSPTKAEQDAGYYSISFYGIDNGKVIDTLTVADDHCPSTVSTSRLVGESAMCLLNDEIPVGGGFWTPVAGMGDKLYARLSQNKILEISNA